MFNIFSIFPKVYVGNLYDTSLEEKYDLILVWITGTATRLQDGHHGCVTQLILSLGPKGLMQELKSYPISHLYDSTIKS